MSTLKARNEAEKRRFEAIIEDKGTIPTQRLKFSYESHKGRRFDLPKRYTEIRLGGQNFSQSGSIWSC